MPCNCKKKQVGTQGELNRGVNGYLALTYHDNGEAYNGPRLNEQVIVVGRLTLDERLFTRDQLDQVSVYSQQVVRAYVMQPAGLFPSEAIERLFAGLPHGEAEAA